jgi:hypothetical protein
MTVFKYTLEELEEELEELEGLKVEAQKDLAKVESPDYDPEFDYEGEEEKQNLIAQDIECERENLAGIEKDIRIIKARIERKRKQVKK